MQNVEHETIPKPELMLPQDVRQKLEQFGIVEYCRALDEGRLEDWPDFFTEDAFYRIIDRRNFDRGLPLGVVYCDGRGMIQDRAYAIAKVLTYAPRYVRHYVTNFRIVSVDNDGSIRAEANYLLAQTIAGQKTTLYQAGRYIDRYVRSHSGFLLKERNCVYDSTIIDTDIVIPV